MSTVYLAGQISGDPAYREKFAAAQIEMEKKGFIVLNPAKLPLGLSNGDYLRICAAMLEASDAVYLLRTWKDSQGAKIEHEMAKYTGKMVMLQDDPLDDLEARIEELKAAGRLEDPPRTETEAQHANGYKGFLLIRCPACGETKGFCVKSEISETRCRACGARFPVVDLLPLFLNCPECGDTFKYYTNIDEPTTWPCLTCKTPVELEMNDSGTAIVTRRKAQEAGVAAMPQRYRR